MKALTIKQCVSELPRARNLVTCLRAASSDKSDVKYVEIGTAFKEDEGLSTYVAARFLKENNLSGNVYSHDMIPEHIEASQKIVKKYDSSLMKRIEWVKGNSNFTVPHTLEKLSSVDAAFIDGSGHPLFNLFELDCIWRKLSSTGVILVDDCNPLAPSPAYAGRRDFGKAQLILPFLMLMEYLNFQSTAMGEKIGEPYDSAKTRAATMEIPTMTEFLQALLASKQVMTDSERYRDADFEILPSNQIIVARRETMQRVRELL